jgi:pantoate--beta-alanine ligase
MEPTLARTIAELDEALMPSRLANAPVAHVPTMGALHAGHVSLLRQARALGDTLVTSVFVNPAQFALGEDFDTYPRDLDADLATAAAAGVDVVFAPDADTIYPGGAPLAITVDPGPVGAIYEGAVRPEHFRGVLTVVAVFFSLIRPTQAVFGEKDYQQLALIRRMVRDLRLGVQIVPAATVRDSDGLALSSRNTRLDAQQRSRAAALSRSLRTGALSAVFGADAVVASAAQVLADADVQPDYLAVVDPELGPAPVRGEARLLVAANFGGTRLIDNVGLVVGPGGGPLDTSIPLHGGRQAS